MSLDRTIYTSDEEYDGDVRLEKTWALLRGTVSVLLLLWESEQHSASPEPRPTQDDLQNLVVSTMSQTHPELVAEFLTGYYLREFVAETLHEMHGMNWIDDLPDGTPSVEELHLEWRAYHGIPLDAPHAT